MGSFSTVNYFLHKILLLWVQFKISLQIGSLVHQTMSFLLLFQVQICTCILSHIKLLKRSCCCGLTAWLRLEVPLGPSAHPPPLAWAGGPGPCGFGRSPRSKLHSLCGKPVPGLWAPTPAQHKVPPGAQREPLVLQFVPTASGSDMV